MQYVEDVQETRSRLVFDLTAVGVHFVPFQRDARLRPSAEPTTIQKFTAAQAPRLNAECFLPGATLTKRHPEVCIAATPLDGVEVPS